MKRLFLLPIITCAACGLVLLSACKEEKEEPLHFETTAPTAYTFPETETSATFSVSGNTAWTVEVTEGRERCTVTPASGKGDATVTVRVTANPDYLQEHTMALLLTSGNYTKEIAITQAAPPCPSFNPGAIATDGQIVAIGGTPVTINSVQNANSGGSVTYQWYKNGTAITGATEAFYTPPPTDATIIGANTYTRRAKDNICNITLIPSEGSWVLTISCPFNAGAIATAGQTVTIDGTPITINSVQNATSNGTISYQWYKNGNAISGATAASYTPPKSDANTAGVYTYTRHAKDNTCNTTFTPSGGAWVLTVVCPAFSPGAIATSGQTVTVGSTPVTINSAQDANSGGSVTYQWYKNGTAISGATEAQYTPPPADAAVVSANTYTRRAKDNVCNTTLTPSEGSWVLTVTCPFDAGAIATTGQTVTIGGTPATINSVQNATAGGTVSYQWYKNGNAISGATAASYTPPKSDANTAGVYTYTRRAKDNICNTTLTPSEGSWVLTVTCPFDAGAIATDGQTIAVGGTPAAINSVQNATAGGIISYQWYKNGAAITGATEAYYTPPKSDANTAGVYTYTRRAKDNICNTTLTLSEGSWVLTITCPFNAGAIATDGQTISVGGTPITINSAQNATGAGIISYQWYKNDIAITGATEVYYTPPPADATVVGANTYTRRAKDNVCNTTLTLSEGNWVLTVVCPAFTAGTITTGEQTICSGSSVNTINSSTNASGGYGTIAYEWRRNGIAINATNATFYNPAAYSTTVGAHTFTRWAKDSYCSTNWTQSAGQWLLIVNGTPTLTLISGNANQTKKQGQAITAIKYTTAHASGAYISSGALPSGVAGSWSANTYTISGDIGHSATVQTYDYTVATTNSIGCTNVSASGQIVVQQADIPTFTGGPNTAYSTTTWIFGSQTWSDRIVVDPSNCTKTDNLSTTDYQSTEYRVYDGRYYYSWTCAYNNRDTFCPYPWRLPTYMDFTTLADNTTHTALLSAWDFGGIAQGTYEPSNSEGALWTSQSTGVNSAYYFRYWLGGARLANGSNWYGVNVRCAK